MSLIARTRFDTPCRVEVALNDDRVAAHVTLADDLPIYPGDRVRVHGAAISLGFGESAVFDRTATVERAGLVERLWTRLIGHFEMTELYEVSFSPGSIR